MLNLAVAFTGPSNSGKTTLISELASLLVDDYKVCIVKHDPKDKAQCDTKGKDSYNFYQTGADVALLSPKRTTFFFHESFSIENIVNTFGEFDFLFVEGLKTLPLPRIYVLRDEIDEAYKNHSDLIVANLQNNDKCDKEILDIKEHEKIINWIKIHAKKVR